MSDTIDNLRGAPPLQSGPEPESRDNEEFQVYSRAEIFALLRDMQDNHLLVTIYFAHGEDFLVSTLLAVNPEFEELVFDAGSDPERNARMYASSRLVVVSFIDRVKLQFTAARAERTTFEGREAVRMRVPDAMLRLQRRDNFRVATSRTHPLACSVRAPGDPLRRLSLTVLELSCGGIGVLVNAEDMVAVPGLMLDEFELELPDLGMIRARLEVRHISEGPGADRRRHRLGCTYVSLAGPMRTLVQRYVNNLERERLTRR